MSPVPTRIYDALKAVKEENEGFLADVLTVEKDMPNVTPLRTPNMEYLSKSEVEALDNAIVHNPPHTRSVSGGASRHR